MISILGIVDLRAVVVRILVTMTSACFLRFGRNAQAVSYVHIIQWYDTVLRVQRKASAELCSSSEGDSKGRRND